MTFATDVSPRKLIPSSRLAPSQRVTRTITLLLLSLTASTADAQDSSAVHGERWLTSVSLGMPGTGAEPLPQLFTIGAQWTYLRPGRVGPDVSIGLIPRALQYGVAAGGLRLGAALPVEVTPVVLLIPSSGLSIVGGAGAGGAGGFAGVNAGLSTVLLTSSGAGFRTGVTWHRFADARRPFWLWEFGIVRGR